MPGGREILTDEPTGKEINYWLVVKTFLFRGDRTSGPCGRDHLPVDCLVDGHQAHLFPARLSREGRDSDWWVDSFLSFMTVGKSRQGSGARQDHNVRHFPEEIEILAASVASQISVSS